VASFDSPPPTSNYTEKMADELEEIDGIKPKVWLPDGEEREVASKSRYVSNFSINDFATMLLCPSDKSL